MCICVNCARIDECTSYHQVEALHQSPHLTSKPQFQPCNVRINIQPAPLEWDVVGCDSFQSDPGKFDRLQKLLQPSSTS